MHLRPAHTSLIPWFVVVVQGVHGENRAFVLFVCLVVVLFFSFMVTSFSTVLFCFGLCWCAVSVVLVWAAGT